MPTHKEIEDFILSNTQKEITISEQSSYEIPSHEQPANGTVYFIDGDTTYVTLPDTSNFKRPGQYIYLINIADSDKNIKLYSNDLNDSLTFNNVRFENTTQEFLLRSGGIVQLLHSSLGWYVISQNGLASLGMN